MASSPVLHLVGEVLVGPEESRPEAWVVGGRLTFERPTAPGADVQTLRGWVLPGLVDAHCHVGLDAHGAVDDATTLAQATAEREAGALLLRDAGSPSDTRWLDERDDLPRVIRAGRHIARTRRYIRNYAWEVEPDELVERVRLEARAGDGWVKLVGDWIDRDAGDLTPCWPLDVLTDAIEAAHEEGARVTAHCFGEASLYDFAAAGTDCIEHATGLEDETLAQFAEQGIAIVPTLVNIAQFPAIAEPAREKFPDYHRRMLTLHERRHATIGAARDAGIARLRRHRRGRRAAARPGRRRGARADPRRLRAGGGPRRRLLGGAPLVGPARHWRRARTPTSSSTPPTRAPRSGRSRRPQHVVLRGREV